VFSIGAVYLGRLIAIAMVVADELRTSFTDIFFDQFGLLTEGWKEGEDGMTYVFLAIAAVTAFAAAPRSPAPKKANA
jgi:hypothetical protein